MKDFIGKIDKLKKELAVLKYQEHELHSESKFLILNEGEYTLQNGKTIIRETASKKIGSGNAVCIFAITEDNQVILTIQPRVILPTEDKVNIEIPAGYIEPGENAIEAALRELEEETGYTTNDLFKVDEYYPSLGFGKEKIELVLALNCTLNGEQHLDTDEYIIMQLVSLEEFETLLNLGYINDVNSRIGYYRYLEYIMKEGS